MWVKCFMQLLWSKGLGWDNPLQSDFATNKCNFFSLSMSTKDVNILIWVMHVSGRKHWPPRFIWCIEIGCACVIYFSFEHLDESVTVRHITSKTREVRQFTSFGNVCCSSTSATSGLLHLYNILSSKIYFSSTHLWCDSQLFWNGCKLLCITSILMSPTGWLRFQNLFLLIADTASL